jgi:hypothetical protein
MDYFNLNILSCKHDVRPCLVIDAILNKIYIRKNAFTTSHPAVKTFYALTDNMHNSELNVLNSIDNETIGHILNS